MQEAAGALLDAAIVSNPPIADAEPGPSQWQLRPMTCLTSRKKEGPLYLASGRCNHTATTGSCGSVYATRICAANRRRSSFAQDRNSRPHAKSRWACKGAMSCICSYVGHPVRAPVQAAPAGSRPPSEFRWAVTTRGAPCQTKTLARKKLNEMNLIHFREAYQFVASEPLTVESSCENPGFICGRLTGNEVGVELTKITRDPGDVFWDKVLDRKEHIEPCEALEYIRNLI
jgi:hypothetical protein